MDYTEKLLERFRNPKNAGEIKDADGVGEVGNLKCGDIMKLFIKVKDGKIADAKFKTFGCAAAIASSDVLCDLAKGKSIDEALNIKSADIAKDIGPMPAIKLHCSVLGAEALHAAIKDYRSRQSKKSKKPKK
jgi:nitrogen fixation NifU-like protein